jgi:hypothetical protein
MPNIDFLIKSINMAVLTYDAWFSLIAQGLWIYYWLWILLDFSVKIGHTRFGRLSYTVYHSVAAIGKPDEGQSIILCTDQHLPCDKISQKLFIVTEDCL